MAFWTDFSETIIPLFTICAVEQKYEQSRSIRAVYSKGLTILSPRSTCHLTSYFTAPQNDSHTLSPFSVYTNSKRGFYTLQIDTALAANNFLVPVNMSGDHVRSLHQKPEFGIFWCTRTLHCGKTFCKQQAKRLNDCFSKWQCAIYFRNSCTFTTHVCVLERCTETISYRLSWCTLWDELRSEDGLLFWL